MPSAKWAGGASSSPFSSEVPEVPFHSGGQFTKQTNNNLVTDGDFLVYKFQNGFSATAVGLLATFLIGVLYYLLYVKGDEVACGGATSRSVVLTHSEAPGDPMLPPGPHPRPPFLLCAAPSPLERHLILEGEF